MNPPINTRNQAPEVVNEGSERNPFAEARSRITRLALSILAATGISATPVMAEKGGTELESVYAAAFTPAEGSEEIQLASINPAEMADAFVGNLRDGLGESITPELESNIDELHQSYIAFSQALIAELNASEPVLGLSPQERAVSPDILTISQAFTAMNMSDQINVLRNFQTGMSVTDSVSGVAAHLGESREAIDSEYGERFMDVITRRGERLARPDVLEPSQQVSVEDYLERLSLIQENNGLYSMYLTYTLDELGNPEAFSGMSEVQFYALMDLARVSYEEGRWDERDDMRRHAGKTEIAMRALFTQSYEEFNARMGDFFERIGYSEAAQIHSEIMLAYTREQEVLQAQADLADAQGDLAEAQRRLELERRIAELLSI